MQGVNNTTSMLMNCLNSTWQTINITTITLLLFQNLMLTINYYYTNKFETA